MKARTKVILGVVAALAFTLAATRAARKAKWERWVAEQEFAFQQARLRQESVAATFRSPNASQQQEVSRFV